MKEFKDVKIGKYFISNDKLFKKIKEVYIDELKINAISVKDGREGMFESDSLVEDDCLKIAKAFLL